MNEITLTIEKVRELAETSEKAKQILKQAYPDVFPPRPFDIEPFECNLFSHLVCIGASLAPPDVRGKCLVLNPDYQWETREFRGLTILIPKK